LSEGREPGILYVSYDGMLEPLGQSQVVAYLEKLAPGRRIHLISFEKPRDWRDEARRQAMRERLGKAGIDWHPLRYHKSPSMPATAYDICRWLGDKPSPGAAPPPGHRSCTQLRARADRRRRQARCRRQSAVRHARLLGRRARRRRARGQRMEPLIAVTKAA
jgi:hypothetical protein